jgi:hypothetical protein
MLTTMAATHTGWADTVTVTITTTTEALLGHDAGMCAFIAMSRCGVLMWGVLSGGAKLIGLWKLFVLQGLRCSTRSLLLFVAS